MLPIWLVQSFTLFLRNLIVFFYDEIFYISLYSKFVEVYHVARNMTKPRQHEAGTLRFEKKNSGPLLQSCSANHRGASALCCRLRRLLVVIAVHHKVTAGLITQEQFVLESPNCAKIAIPTSSTVRLECLDVNALATSDRKLSRNRRQCRLQRRRVKFLENG